MLIDCRCGKTNRAPGLSSKRLKCGACGHLFTPTELLKARHEPPPAQDLELEDKSEEEDDDSND